MSTPPRGIYDATAASYAAHEIAELRAILDAAHGALADASTIPVPPRGEHIADAIRALTAERDGYREALEAIRKILKEDHPGWPDDPCEACSALDVARQSLTAGGRDAPAASPGADPRRGVSEGG